MHQNGRHSGVDQGGGLLGPLQKMAVNCHPLQVVLTLTKDQGKAGVVKILSLPRDEERKENALSSEQILSVLCCCFGVCVVFLHMAGVVVVDLQPYVSHFQS